MERVLVGGLELLAEFALVGLGLARDRLEILNVLDQRFTQVLYPHLVVLAFPNFQRSGVG